MDISVLVPPFLGALQASIAVLLTIFWGVLAAQFNLMSGSTAKEVSRLCVKMLLPALLLYRVGSELHTSTGMRYVPILCTCSLGIDAGKSVADNLKFGPL